MRSANIYLREGLRPTATHKELTVSRGGSSGNTNNEEAGATGGSVVLSKLREGGCVAHRMLGSIMEDVAFACELVRDLQMPK